jgi:ferritin
MKPNPKLIKLINYRINQEEYSSRVYHAMSVWLDNNAYKSTSLWKTYSDEELKHAHKAYEFLLSFGIMPEIQVIDNVEVEYKDLADIIQKTFAHEMLISQQCESLYMAGIEEKNPMVMELGRWFVSEQIEELSKAQTLVDLLRTFGTDKIAQMLIDDRISG